MTPEALATRTASEGHAAAPADFPHLYWIGGSPCSGKSTIADRLAAHHGMQVFRCDDAYFQHIERLTPEEHPVFSKIAYDSCDAVWMRPIAQQVSEAIALYREEFALILDDLRELDRARPVIVEGAALLPELLYRSGIGQRRAIWVIPTEAFQREHYAKRDWRHAVLKDCRDPEQAWHNWMARDVTFASMVAQDVERSGYQALLFDGSQSLDETAHIVEEHFGLTRK